MAQFKKGDTVQLKAVVPQGPVMAMRMDDDGNVQYLIGWAVDDEPQQRWFDEAQLEAV
jgi:hypothetical protein